MALVLGLYSDCISSINDILDVAQTNKLEFVCIPLFHPRLSRDNLGISDARPGPITRSDFCLSCSDWTSNVVGVISSSIDLDNHCDHVRLSSEKMFTQEVNWAVHLGLQAVILPCPKSGKVFNYSKCLLQLMPKCRFQHLWLTIPLTLSTEFSTEIPDFDSWTLWNMVRSMTNYNPKLSIILDLSDDLCNYSEVNAERWIAEPVKALILPTRIFLTNASGYPVLSKDVQQLLKMFLKSKIHIIFRGKSRHGEDYTSYMEYLKFLKYRQNQEIPEGERFTQGYLDTLQMPLQPLMDNLESQTYEVFEKDPVKYREYERAIAAALVDYLPKQVDSEPLVIMVVGAGRGPLVQCARSAAMTQNIAVKIYAVEKNPNAVITLRNRALSQQWDNVTIIACDMRLFQPTEQADILVSELLGSWGDNELSPECLLGAQRFLRPGGVSIPANSTSFVCPVSTSKLWMMARDMPDIRGLETPFVVKFHSYFEIDVSQSLFWFEHPDYSSTSFDR